VNGHLSGVLSAGTLVDTEKATILNAKRTIAESTESLKKLKEGTDPLDLQSSRLSVTQREHTLRDARETLANYFVRAPFNGTVATVAVRKGDSITSGTAVSTFITKDKIAEISLNEVDVAKVSVGQSVTLTFDAVDGLTITGKVIDVSTIGTVSQGVVTYAVKINFDTNDDRVRSGMSVSAAVVTEVKHDVVLVPNSAIKTQGNQSYVEVFAPPLLADTGAQGTISGTPPARVLVVTGASNDTATEILSGIDVGAQVVTRTITSSATAAAQAPSIFSAAGVRTPGGGGSGMRGGAMGR
jgi:HlyD family secretion protein